MHSAIESPHWYRHPMMWLVVSLPAGAVLAGLITAVLILQHPDKDVRSPQAMHAVVLHGHASNSVVPPGE